MSRKRRGRGEGSIFQRADGRWVVRIALGVDASGKRRRKTLYAPTKQTAMKKLKEFDPEKQVDAKGWTLAKLASHWLTNVAPRKAGPPTVDRYRAAIDRTIVPLIGHLKLSAINAAAVEDFYAKLPQVKTTRDTLLSSRSQHLAGAVLTTMLAHAVKLKLVAGNPAREVSKPSYRRADRRVWTPDEARRFLAACRGHRHEVLFLLALGTGLREGEILALNWDAIDFNAGTVTVRHSLVDHRGERYLKAPKTGRVRVVTLPKMVLDGLHDLRARAFAAGRLDCPVFHNRTGGWLRRENLLRESFYKLVEKAGVPKVTLHDVRHAHATHLLAAGVDAKTVSTRLGHSTVKTTLDFYVSTLPEMAQAAADQTDRLYRVQERVQRDPSQVQANPAS
ncbi:MAG: tyrosine-type recombinase/integrase [Pirellulales bacterium]